ncbi:hypothetical protein ACO7RW_01255 [Bacillus amyloliquefaciens]|nr:hypothetical protein [Bacillus velezensis]MDV5127020.1 hypothetical protein [Bacillus velezensis]
MANYFCNKCKEICTKEEIDLIEDEREGDWQEVHSTCSEKVTWF